MTASVRPRTAQDLPALVSLLQATHEADGYPTHWPRDPRRVVAPPYEEAAGVAVVASATGDVAAGEGPVAGGEGPVAGHVALHEPLQDPACEQAMAATGLVADRLVAVGRLFTAPGRRREGLGRLLLDHARAMAEARDRRPFLNVVQRLGGAVALYQSSGWTNVGPLTISFADGRALDTFVFVGPEQAAGRPASSLLE